MKERHLRLVSCSGECSRKGVLFLRYADKLKTFYRQVFTSKREKIFILKDALIKIYRDYEISTGISDIPYYVRAELKISKILQENKVDYYFNLIEKFKKSNLA